jgi:hypothetical protein
LPDPDKVLKGSGTRVRHIVLTDPKILGQPAVKKLMALALKVSEPIDSTAMARRSVKFLAVSLEYFSPLLASSLMLGSRSF